MWWGWISCLISLWPSHYCTVRWRWGEARQQQGQCGVSTLAKPIQCSSIHLHCHYIAPAPPCLCVLEGGQVNGPAPLHNPFLTSFQTVGSHNCTKCSFLLWVLCPCDAQSLCQTHHVSGSQLTPGTSLPLSRLSLMILLLSDNDDISRWMRPSVDRCKNPYFCANFSHWVPLPEPGPPLWANTSS